jgi:[citrate (pro-3S)-lyase] ligase
LQGSLLNGKEYKLNNIDCPDLEGLNFSEYIQKLIPFAQRYTVIIVAHGTPCGSPEFTKEIAASLCYSLGIKALLHDKMNYAYTAVIDKGQVVFELLDNKQDICLKSKLLDFQIDVKSSFYKEDRTHESYVILNGDYKLGLTIGLSFIVFDRETMRLFDCVSYPTVQKSFISIATFNHSKFNLFLYEKFRDSHPEVRFIRYRFPPQNDISDPKLATPNVISELKKGNGDNYHTYIHDYLPNAQDIAEVLNQPESYMIDGDKRYFDYSGKYVNCFDGHRITLHQPQNAKRNIYLFDHCIGFGNGVPDAMTCATYLQQLLNEYAANECFAVHNYGMYMANLDDKTIMFQKLSLLNLKAGDIVLLNLYSGHSDNIVPPLPTKEYGEIFFDDVGHLTAGGQRFTADYIFDYLKNKGFFHQWYESVKNISKEEKKYEDQNHNRYGFTLEQVEQLETYKEMLQGVYRSLLKKGENTPQIGSIVMNCNPFHNGHLYLIETARKQCDYLVIFVVQEDHSFFPFHDRFDLIEKATSDMNNVILIPSGQFIISFLTFSEYFNKKELQDKTIDTSKDVLLFAEEIAPAMHITKRFVGTEPFDHVTNQYNKTLREVLPKHDIEFVEIERIKTSGEAVSASTVRTLLDERNWTEIEKLVPKTTLNYLKEKFANW